jgi:murein DD-endopeptidase MepM/ murein hydrolase activator NlpD
MEDKNNNSLRGDNLAGNEETNLNYPPEIKTKKTGLIEIITNLGLSEQVARYGTIVFTILMVIGLIIILNGLFKGNIALTPLTSGVAVPTQNPSTEMKVAALPMIDPISSGVVRKAQIHTNIPDRPRSEVIQYTVAKGDTVIGISEKYNLKPQTIMFGNYYTLRDDPHNLSIGTVLNILPVDGYYYEWQVGDGLNGVAKGLSVTPEDIINYPLNNLDAATIGDFGNPNIKPGTWLIVPNGFRAYTSWTAPVGVTRENPATARIMGAGACEAVVDGAVGLGYFVWPADKHFLSGFDYSPDTNHRGIDIAGNTGEPVYAVDAGVIVYAGWNDWGYGNMIMVDHGNGWQSLYAHLNSLNVGCGQSVDMGWAIGTIGSTGKSSGSHLHFELMHSTYSKVNPWSYLPPP